MKQVIKAKVANVNVAVSTARSQLEEIVTDLQERLNELEDSDSSVGEELESGIALLEETLASLEEAETLLDQFP